MRFEQRIVQPPLILMEEHRQQHRRWVRQTRNAMVGQPNHASDMAQSVVVPMRFGVQVCDTLQPVSRSVDRHSNTANALLPSLLDRISHHH
jgi:hypothetical protein